MFPPTYSGQVQDEDRDIDTTMFLTDPVRHAMGGDNEAYFEGDADDKKTVTLHRRVPKPDDWRMLDLWCGF